MLEPDNQSDRDSAYGSQAPDPSSHAADSTCPELASGSRARQPRQPSTSSKSESRLSSQSQVEAPKARFVGRTPAFARAAPPPACGWD